MSRRETVFNMANATGPPWIIPDAPPVLPSVRPGDSVRTVSRLRVERARDPRYHPRDELTPLRTRVGHEDGTGLGELRSEG